ncbi:hypothetical protein [Paenibacillus thalictri]|uniref:Restriction system protein Mrr-like N-terminal domain-containing protein n=1 Tax=Paenibacillus thalictri TaxID=2527873 RepID=A0A4V2J2X2_9BACL|nr:hypothetical protein [Paenibacillus thalictri]TBL67461.1 hypothetical protein EYB31_39685 [Paenibacillus thalictri]
MTRQKLIDKVEEAIKSYNGKATIVQISKYIWDNYEQELRESGDIFYTWQYEIRWAAKKLRDKGIMKSVDMSPRGIWEIS